MGSETPSDVVTERHIVNGPALVRRDLHGGLMTEITGSEALARVAQLMKDIDIAMLTTIDEDRNLVSRPMSTRQVDEAGNIWFFTADDTAKVEEAQRHRDVGLAYCDAKGMRYVSVAGTAEIVHDRTKMEELYSASLETWFSDGLDTPGIALLKVTPKVTEFWEPAKGKLALAAGALRSIVTRDVPDDDTMNHGYVTS